MIKSQRRIPLHDASRAKTKHLSVMPPPLSEKFRTCRARSAMRLRGPSLKGSRRPAGKRVSSAQNYVLDWAHLITLNHQTYADTPRVESSEKGTRAVPGGINTKSDVKQPRSQRSRLFTSPPEYSAAGQAQNVKLLQDSERLRCRLLMISDPRNDSTSTRVSVDLVSPKKSRGKPLVFAGAGSSIDSGCCRCGWRLYINWWRTKP